MNLPSDTPRVDALITDNGDGTETIHMTRIQELAYQMERELAGARGAVVDDIIRYLDHLGVASCLLGWGEQQPKHTVRWHLEKYLRMVDASGESGIHAKPKSCPFGYGSGPCSDPACGAGCQYAEPGEHLATTPGQPKP